MPVRVVARFAFALAITHIVVAIPAQNAPPLGGVRSLAGCYALTLGSWSGPLPKSDPAAAFTPPSRFRLDTLPAVRGSYAVEPTSLVPSAHTRTSWRPTAADSVQIIWSTGFGGVRLQLRAAGDTLKGHATTFTDIHTHQDPSASIIAIRMRCAPAR